MGTLANARALVLHAIPTRWPRGQIEARAIADRLDEPGSAGRAVLPVRRADDVHVEHSVGYPAANRAARGFRPGLVLQLRSALRRLAPRSSWPTAETH